MRRRCARLDVFLQHTQHLEYGIFALISLPLAPPCCSPLADLGRARVLARAGGAVVACASWVVWCTPQRQTHYAHSFSFASFRSARPSMFLSFFLPTSYHSFIVVVRLEIALVLVLFPVSTVCSDITLNTDCRNC